MNFRKITFFFTLLLFLWLSLGILSTRFALPVPSIHNPNYKSSLFDSCGNIHFHTIHSDGSGTIPEIVQAAHNSNLDFIIATDHGSVNNIQEEKTNGLLLLSGSEIGTESGHHLKIGPLKIIAHPFDWLIPWKGIKNQNEFDGVEIINGASLAHKSMIKIFPILWSLLIYPFNPGYSLFSIYENPDRELQYWDHLNQTKRMTGFVGADAHAKIDILKKYDLYIKFPSYQSVFKSMKMHVLTKEDFRSLPFLKARELLYNTLKQGRCYFSIDLLLDPSGFRYTVSRPGETGMMGDTLTLGKSQKALIEVMLGNKLPRVPVEIHILRNGNIVSATNEYGLKYQTEETGIYRAEVYLTIKNILGIKRKVLWIGSNPITLQKM